MYLHMCPWLAQSTLQKLKKKKNLKVILSILKIYFSLSNLWYTSTFRNNFEKLIKEDKGNKSFKKVGKARSVER